MPQVAIGTHLAKSSLVEKQLEVIYNTIMSPTLLWHAVQLNSLMYNYNPTSAY
jgi:hypothetical protein